MSLEDHSFFYRHFRWWFFYIFIFVSTHICLTSIGAFFHFLLDHEISLVEGWLHKNGWELAVTSKVFSLWIFHRFLQVRLYNPKPIRQFVKKEWRWPDQRLIVAIVFVCISLVYLGKPIYQAQNQSFLWYQFITFFCFGLWFLADYFTIAILQDLFPITIKKSKRYQLAFYVLGFCISFRLIVPDYFGTVVLMHLHFISILLITGKNFQSWGNALFYLCLLAAPAAAILGIDPIWGADYSPFKLTRIPHTAFLITIWVLSLAYYRYRHRWRWPILSK
jgi:hypothetical protein